MTGWLRARLQNRSDTEHVMSANRAFFCIALTAYIEVRQIGPAGLGPWFLGAGLAMTGLIFLHIVAYPAPNAIRRTVALTADFATLCTMMHFTNEEGAAFYPLILWTIFGNGFRFGLAALWVAVLLGFMGFALVAVSTPFWREHTSLAVGLGLGTLILPAYAGVLIRSLMQARQRAEAANEVKSTFLTNVSHELRTPLQALVGTTDLLKKTRLSPDQVELIQITSTASQTLLSMINDFLHFTGLGGPDAELEIRSTDPITLLREVAGLSSPACNAKELRLAMHVGLGTPPMVDADGRHIREVLLNLVGNALKFTAKGGILLAVDRSGSQDGLFLEFSVADTGIGVHDSAKERIFERFTQADPTIAQRYGGTGLGLAICRRLVERMGGRLGVRDGAAGGSVFWFEVPAALGLAALGEGAAVAAPPAPIALAMADGPARSRLADAGAGQGRGVTWVVADRWELAVQALAEQGVGHILVLPTDVVAQRHRELSALLSRKARTDRRPIVLVDQAGSRASSSPKDGPRDVPWDLRWVATARLPARFTDEQMLRALAIADRFAEIVADHAGQDPEPSPPEPSRVLIVDDNKTNQLIYSKLLENTGYACQIAVNGEEALDALDESGFDLVLMDVNMPVINGIDATKLQRLAELGVSRVPIIGITADASPEMQKKCLAAGMDACLIKPVSSPALLGLVRELLSKAVPAPHATPAGETVPQGQGLDIDWQPLNGLAKVGGQDFLREVLTEFMKDCGELLDELRAALAEKQVGLTRAAAHAIASTSSNVGALRVRSLALQFERLPEEAIDREGAERAKAIGVAIDGYLKALGGVVGEVGGRPVDLD